MHSRKMLPEKVLEKCGYCGRRISSNSPIYGLGCKTKPEIDISEYRGGAMEVFVVSLGKNIGAIVPTEDSDAQKEGNDLLFATCSGKCGDELKAALATDLSLGQMIGSIQRIKN